MKTLDEAIACMVVKLDDPIDTEEKLYQRTQRYNQILAPTILEIVQHPLIHIMLDSMIMVAHEIQEEKKSDEVFFVTKLCQLCFTQGFTLAYEMFNTLTDEKMEKEFSS